VGICFAHLNSWAIAAAPPGESSRTALALPTLQSLGIAFGAAFAGLVANAAGLATEISPAAVTAAGSWVYGLSFLAPAALFILAVHLVGLRRQLSQRSASTVDSGSS
jgi:hypothetical protein